MKREELKQDLLKSITQAGFNKESLTLEQFAFLLFEQYENIRVDGCDLDKEKDMLFFTSSYSIDNSNISIELGRQCIVPETAKGLRMSHLLATFSFDIANAEKTEAMYIWCEKPDRLPHFKSELLANAVYAHYKSIHPMQVRIEYEDD